MNKENFLKQLSDKIPDFLKQAPWKLISTEDTLFPQVRTMEAHFNTDLRLGHFLFSLEEVLTLKLIGKTKRHFLERCLINVWHLIAEIWHLFLSFDLNLKISRKIPIHTQVKLISDKNFSNLLRLSKFNSGLYLQTTVEFWYRSKFENCCDLRLF